MPDDKQTQIAAEFSITEAKLLARCAEEKFGGASRAAVVRIAVKELLIKYGYVPANSIPG